VPVSAVDKEWMKGSPLKGALLALLLEQREPTHPWKLATSLKRRLGPGSGVETDAVYKMLPVLEKQGLVVCTTRENTSGRGLTRQKVYGPTDLTESAVSDWIATPVSEDTARTELQVKIAFSRPSDAPMLLRMLDLYERQCMDRLSRCKDTEVLMSSWVGVAMNVACSWTEEHLEAEMRWIMRARESICDYRALYGVAQ
jgi:DNA-binding PadR family transcriptional regulator